MKLALTICCLLLVLRRITSFTSFKEAGVLAFISNNGVDDVVKSVSNYYADKLLHNVYHFNNVNTSFMLFIWDWDWKLTNIEFQKVTKPYAKSWPEEGKIHLILEDLAMDLTGDFEANSKKRLFVERGKLQAHVCFHFEASFYYDSNNTVLVDSCFSRFTCTPVIMLNLHNNMPKFVNNALSKEVQKHLNPQMLCDSLSQFGTDYDIYTIIREPDFAIDLSLHHFVGATENGLALALNGEMFDFTKAPYGDKNPIYAPPLPQPSFNKYKMTTFVMGNYMINTFMLTAIRKGLFKKTFRTELLPDDQRVFFATKCLDVCIGKDVPEIGKMFPQPDKFVSFRINANEDRIETSIDEKGCTLRNSGEIEFFIGNTTLFSVKTDLQVHGAMSMKPKTVTIEAKLTQFRVFNITLISTKVGHISNDVLELIADMVKKVQIIPMINDTFDKGIDMGSFIWIQNKETLQRQIVHFIDAEVELVKDAIIASADFTLKINDIGLHRDPL